MKDSLLNRKYRCTDSLPPTVTHVISDVMERIDAIYPDEFTMQRIIEWISKGLNQEELTIFSPICPDYSVESTGNPVCPFRHTFNELGSGLGLIAQRIIAALPELVNALRSCHLKIKVVIGIGDFEAYSDANLNRLNINQATFLERVEKSKQAFENTSPIAVDVQMVTDMFGGYRAWLNLYNEFTKRLNQGKFGASALTEEKLLQIVRKRKNLYDRWYGEKTLTAHLPQLLMQGAEYAVLGSMISKTMNNCLVLGADNDAMSPFYSVEQTLPTLYLKRFYC
jgi:hypothetical protein